jgi:AbrB family looped-hinge helix DNA binding protein
MSQAKPITTVVSTKGQVILPKSIRDGKGWRPGQQLVVEETRDGVLLRARSPFAATKPEDVFGSLSHHGKSLSERDIERALRGAAKRRYARD